MTFDGARLIQEERKRQIWDERWTPEHDDEHTDGSLALAAACYARHAATVPYLPDIEAYRTSPAPDDWPWHVDWWKPVQPQRDLVKAGALAAAEIDRITRDIIRRGGSPNCDKGE